MFRPVLILVFFLGFLVALDALGAGLVVVSAPPCDGLLFLKKEPDIPAAAPLFLILSRFFLLPVIPALHIVNSYLLIFKPDPLPDPLYCVPETPRPSVLLAPLRLFFKPVAFESTAFSRSDGAASGGGGGATVGGGGGAFGVDKHIIKSLLVGHSLT